jgi:hypothetical protein
MMTGCEITTVAKQIREIAVSCTAFLAHILDKPTLDSGFRSLSVNTSIPFLISAWRIHVVLQYEAQELATAATNALISINFDPVADLVIPDVIFLRVMATTSDEETAIPYPYAKS